MQSLPAVSSTQTPSASASTSSTGSSSVGEGPGFAQVLSEQSSRSTQADEADRAAATSAHAAAPSTASGSAAGAASASASAANGKKTAVSSSHAVDTSNPANASPATSTQAAQSAASERAAALHPANSINTPDASSGDDANPVRTSSLAGSFATSSVALTTTNATAPTSTALLAQAGAEEDSAPCASNIATDDGEGEITALKDDHLGSAPGGASAALHTAASFTSSLAQARAYLGSDSGDHQKNESNASDAAAQLTPIGGTTSLSASVTPTTVQGSCSADSSPSTAVASANVPYPMGSDAWRADVSSHVLYFTQQNLQEAQLHLNPAHLGPLEITIRSENNQTSLAFSAAHEATRQAMQDSLPQLKQLFASQGVALGNTTVSDQSQGSGNTRQQSSGSPSTQSQNVLATPVVATSAIALSSWSMVDTFA